MIPRVNIDPIKDVRRFARATTAQFYTDNLDVLSDVFHKSLLAHHGSYPMLALQVELLGHILAADNAKRVYGRYKQLIRKAIRGLGSKGATPQRMKEAQSRLRDMEYDEMAGQWLLERLRVIGDGIAWRFLNYDRGALRLIAEHEPISVPEELNTGLLSEIKELARLHYDDGRQALLNVITNFLRVGDITTYDPQSGRIGLIEVKSSDNTSLRVQRQGQYLALVQQGLDSNVSNFAGVKIRRVESQNPLKTYIRSFENALIEAEQKLAASRKFSDYLSVAIFAQEKIIHSVPEEKWGEIRAPVLNRLYSVRGGVSDVLTPCIDNLSYIAHFSPNLAPYPVFPIKTRFRLGLLTGDFLVLAMMNISGLARGLERRGWQTEVLQPPDKVPGPSEVPYAAAMRVFRDGIGTELDLGLLMAAAVELWMPESIEESVRTIIDNVPTIRPEDPQRFSEVVFPNVGKHAWD